MPRISYYGIHYPFTADGIDKNFIDLDSNPQKAMESEIMHLIFTPKGQRLRNPDFGSNLIRYIFNPNDEMTWADVKREINESVSKYVPAVTITHLDVYQGRDDNHGLVVELSYRTDEGKLGTIVTKI